VLTTHRIAPPAPPAPQAPGAFDSHGHLHTYESTSRGLQPVSALASFLDFGLPQSVRGTSVPAAAATVVAIWDTGDVFAVGRTRYQPPAGGPPSRVVHCVSISDWLNGAQGLDARNVAKASRERLFTGGDGDRQDELMIKIHRCLECMHDRPHNG
jgi:hypothetical protein